jgi:hypothetical protein
MDCIAQVYNRIISMLTTPYMSMSINYCIYFFIVIHYYMCLPGKVLYVSHIYIQLFFIYLSIQLFITYTTWFSLIMCNNQLCFFDGIFKQVHAFRKGVVVNMRSASPVARHYTEIYVYKQRLVVESANIHILHFLFCCCLLPCIL